MAFVAPPKETKILIDLRGPHGNVFHLIGVAKNLARQLSMDGDKIGERMMAGSYYNAVAVFDELFGNYVDIVLPNGMTENDLILGVISNAR